MFPHVKVHAAPPASATRRILWGVVAFPHVRVHVECIESHTILTTDSVGHRGSPTAGGEVLHCSSANSSLSQHETGDRDSRLIVGIHCVSARQSQHAFQTLAAQTLRFYFSALHDRFRTSPWGPVHRSIFAYSSAPFRTSTCGNKTYPHVNVGFRHVLQSALGTAY